MILMASERRQSRRWHCSGEAEIIFSMNSPPVHARIADLSAEGCMLIVKQPVDLESEMQVELAFTINQLPFRVRARMKANRSETRYGFQFLQVSSRSQRRLKELVEELEENQRKQVRGLKGANAGIELS